MQTIANLCPYWTYPPTSGGQLRVYNMNQNVSESMRVLQFSMRPTWGHQQRGFSAWLGTRICEITDTYTEVQYFDPTILISGYLLHCMGFQSDLFMSDIINLKLPQKLEQLIDQASFIQVEHPWLFRLAYRLAQGRPIIYVAHNIEAKLWDRQSPVNFRRVREFCKRSHLLELETSAGADYIVAMSEEDAQVLASAYGVDSERIQIIENGVDIELRKPARHEQKLAAKRKLNLDDRPVLLFVGSDHYPNKEALNLIFQWDQQFGERGTIQFLIVGGVGQGIKTTRNIRVTGHVENLKDYLAASDIALNPLTSGSGTSLKAVEYLACGLPTISTAIGIRGLNLEPDRHVVVCDVPQFPEQWTRLIQDNQLRQRLSCNGRQVAEERYSWKRLSRKMVKVYELVQNASLHNRRCDRTS